MPLGISETSFRLISIMGINGSPRLAVLENELLGGHLVKVYLFNLLTDFALSLSHRFLYLIPFFS